jgi:hypothetical protein
MAIVAGDEALAAEAGLVQRVALQHGAHAAVEYQDALAQGGFEQRDAFGMEPGKGAHGMVLDVQVKRVTYAPAG